MPPARFAVPLAVVALLAMAAWFTWLRATEPPGYLGLIEDPEANDGVYVQLILYDVLAIESPGYRIGKGPVEVAIHADVGEVEVGDTVSVGGRFRADDLGVDEEWRELHPLRLAKKALGIVGLVVTLVLGPVFFAVRGRLEERSWPTS